MININNNQYKLNINNIQPLTGKTERTLQHYIFKNSPIEGACLKYQSLATKAKQLKDLQDEFKTGTIDLGNKDRAWAIAKCIGSALLVAATAILAFGIIYHAVCLLSSDDGIAAIGAVSVMPLVGSLGLFGSQVYHAIEVFKRPNPEQLQKQIDELSNEKISSEEIIQMQKIGSQLRENVASLDSQIARAGEIGSTAQKDNLKNLKTELEQAFKDFNSKFIRNLQLNAAV